LTTCPDTVASCAELLGLYGYDARTAGGAAEARALLDGWEPDVALVDLCMPGLNGFELARRLCARGADRPLLVAVTGLGTRTYRDQAAVGFDHFLVKPVDPDVMFDLLRVYGARLVCPRGEKQAECSPSLSGITRTRDWSVC
jgi:CheY-like chemotaxis protein